MTDIDNIVVLPNGASIEFWMVDGTKIVKNFGRKVPGKGQVDPHGFVMLALAGAILTLTERIEQLENKE